MKLREQAAFYDERWRDFTYANNLKLQRAAAILGELAKLRFQKPQIVDLGCGAGWLTSILSQFGPTTGVELSRLAVERASQRFPGTLFVAGGRPGSTPEA